MSYTYLSDSDRECLRRLPFPVALPQELPSGWKAQPLVVFEDPEENEASAEVTFVGPQSSSWSVTTADGGIGDAIPGESDYSFESLAHGVFGNILVHRFTEEAPEVLSDWFPEEEEAGCYHSFRGANVSEADLKLLVGSLDLFDTSKG